MICDAGEPQAWRLDLDISFHTEADPQELDHLITRCKNAEQRDRYRAALLAASGQETSAIIEALARSRGFVQRWAYAYRDGGIPALQAKKRGGRRSRLEAQEKQRLLQRVQAGPLEQVDQGLCTLRGKDVQRILQDEFGKSYSLGGVYDLMHQVGLSCLRPRPRHRKSDPAAMKQWLDSAPLLSKK